MADARKDLHIYEALELRAEYDARIKTLRNLLPEGRKNQERFVFSGDDQTRRRPVAGFDVEGTREELASLELRRRKLNNAIQRVNFENLVEVDGREINLAEALELRKSVNDQIGELSTQLAASAYEQVIYKEGRDIVEGPHLDFGRVRETLERTRLLFRELNRKLRGASFQVAVDFKDE